MNLSDEEKRKLREDFTKMGTWGSWSLRGISVEHNGTWDGTNHILELEEFFVHSVSRIQRLLDEIEAVNPPPPAPPKRRWQFWR